MVVQNETWLTHSPAPPQLTRPGRHLESTGRTRTTLQRRKVRPRFQRRQFFYNPIAAMLFRGATARAPMGTRGACRQCSVLDGLGRPNITLTIGPHVQAAEPKHAGRNQIA